MVKNNTKSAKQRFSEAQKTISLRRAFSCYPVRPGYEITETSFELFILDDVIRQINPLDLDRRQTTAATTQTSDPRNWPKFSYHCSVQFVLLSRLLSLMNTTRKANKLSVAICALVSTSLYETRFAFLSIRRARYGFK